MGSGARGKANQAALRSDWDAAVAYYREAVQEDPKALELKIQLERAMREAGSLHITRAKKLEEQDQLAGAAARIPPGRRVRPVQLAGAEPRARRSNAGCATWRRPSRPRTRMDEMRQQATQTSPIPEAGSAHAASGLSFNNSSVRDILNLIGDATGINVTYDQGLEGTIARPYSINTTDVPLEIRPEPDHDDVHLDVQGARSAQDLRVSGQRRQPRQVRGPVPADVLSVARRRGRSVPDPQPDAERVHGGQPADRHAAQVAQRD